MKKKVALYTLGCKLNQVDTEYIRESFARAGYEAVDFKDDADVYVVNTCTVTSATDHQARQMLRRAIRRKAGNPSVRVVAAGCYAQTNSEEIIKELPGLDIIVGSLDKERIPDMLERLEGGAAELSEVRDVFEERTFRPVEIDSFSDYTRAFLRIQEGCDSRCSYCIVPFARGRSRSAQPADVLRQAEKFAAAGYREIVLAGIHIGRYGIDLVPRTSLAELLLKLNDVEGIDRIRLSSIDPKEFSDELYDALDRIRDRLCPHFHVSLQSGDDEMLKKMKRNYTRDDFSAVVERLREMFPDVSVGADVIVGFPGESFEAFQNTCELVKKTRLSYLHVFRYSRRAGTPAAEMPDQLNEEVKQLRSKQLHEIKKELEDAYRETFVGKDVEVMLETRRIGEKQRLTGLTRHYIRVFGDGGDELMGRMAMARIARAERGGLEAANLIVV